MYVKDNFQQRGGSPWGTPPGGGNGNGSGKGPTPPDIDKIIRELQEKIKKFLPGGTSSGGKPIMLAINNFRICFGWQVVFIEFYQMNKELF